MAAATTPGTTELTPRRRAVWVAVVAGGGASLVLAGRSLAVAPATGPHALFGVLVLLALAMVAQRRPLPLRDGEAMYLTGVPLVCAAVMYGAAVTAAIAVAAYLAEQLSMRLRPARMLFNSAVWGLMGGAGGLAAHVRGQGDLSLLAAVALAACAQEVTNIGLVSVMLGDARLRESAAAAWYGVKLVSLPFALSLSVVPLFAVAWPAHPLLALFAVGPLAAVALYLRSQDATRHATALALTDALTALGNRRSFRHRLERELDRAEDIGAPVSVCLLDLDGFKQINDRYGHDAGDAVLASVAQVLRQDGEAFRYGGDEFVLLLPGLDRGAAAAVADAVRGRVRELDVIEEPLSISVGVATYPDHGALRSELVRAADQALYLHKQSSAG